ncbi:Uma2 family endonuclease [Ancylothrix sp. C2]|uniref:Uma2 family endonuclease n=1 Tax=Ancylothrix sp. D3o TaxID=2953691 RepID=UPI0021BAAF76|nr:Uma2 family endonuclease [Ancylothrix sp. D3o]MCT7951574.1 Uma2 family endonuclease [Ancylothrix sp. D3o]
MVTAVPNPEVQQIDSPKTVVLMGVSWQTFMALLAEVGEDRATRFAYDRGVLEIRMPLIQHEIPKGLLESFIEAIADELEIEVMKAGALSLKREDLSRFIEPDSCFYIQNEALVRAKDDINLPADPPPDLAIESDFTSSSLNKFTIYASLGVPELWRYRNQKLEIYQLIEGEYQPSEKSLAFPFLPVAEVAGFIEQSKTLGQRSAVREFKKRIKEILESQN